jgi:hypothetical protein
MGIFKMTEIVCPHCQEKECDQFKAEFSNSKIAKHLAVDNALADINC